MSEPSTLATQLPIRSAAAPAQRSALPASPSLPQHATLAAQRTQRALTRLIPQLRYQLLRVGPAGLVGICALIAASITTLAIWLPAHQAELALRTQLLHSQRANPGGSRAVSPDRLVAVLPTRAQIPAVLGQMLAEADKAGVALDQGHYDYRPPQSGSLGRYAFEFPVKGNYPNVRDFIDRALTAVPAAGLDKLRVERKSVGDALINADIGFVIYVRGE
jgi:hypothetical protein